MTLDEKVLTEAKEIRGTLIDLETQAAHARIDYHAAIKKLHASGGSLREIAEALELSHQRVHQIVEGPPAVPGPPPWVPRGGWRRHRGRHGGNRKFFVARFDDGAREVMVDAQKEADGLKHNYIGTEHLMLALVKRGVEGVSYDAAHERVVEQVGEGDEPWIEGMPRPFTPRAKRVLEAALNDATDAGREQFGPDEILLAIVSDSRGVGGEVLRDLGVTPEKLREQPEQ
jgi:Clp amino terminal domain, pathogenicity island component